MGNKIRLKREDNGNSGRIIDFLKYIIALVQSFTPDVSMY